MTEATEKVAISVATEVMQWLRDSKDFITEQAPDLAHQIVMWGIAREIGTAIACLIVCGAFAVMAWKLYQQHVVWSQKPRSSMHYEDDGGRLGAIITLTGLAFLSAFMSLTAMVCTIKPIVAPKLYVVEQLAKLLQ